MNAAALGLSVRLPVFALVVVLLAACQQRTVPIAANVDASVDTIVLPDTRVEVDFGSQRDMAGGEVDPTCVPRPETCNERDDDCDGDVDDGFQLLTDPMNCGRCGVVCGFANAPGVCSAGQCRFTGCNAGFVDLDGLPQNGCECTLDNGGVEICDGKDNNCDGTTDEGFDLRQDVKNCGACGRVCAFDNAGASCTLGACRMDACMPGSVDLDKSVLNGCEYACAPGNGGVEICDGIDNDCNGVVDEADPRAGSACFPMGVIGCNPATGTCAGGCKLGSFVCLPGGLTCRGAVLPEAEICDSKDNDCDGTSDEDFDLAGDPRWCGGCGNVCALAHAVSGCAAGACTVRSCQVGFVDLDGVASNGCEYACTIDGPEVCDGKDNDCDGRLDDADPDLLFPTQNFCVQRGECGGGPGGSTRYAERTFPVCVPPTPGAAPDWVCNYPATVQLFGPNQIAGEELRCDGLDNDCDGSIDEDMKPQVGSACLDNGLGECKRTGVVRCAADPTASPVCDVTGVPVPPAQHETCDGKDNDCDGLVDESWDTTDGSGAPACTGGVCRGVRDDVAFVSFVPRPFYIHRFEASRADATNADQGKLGGRACSRGTPAPVVPWSSVTHAEATAACAAAGMRLCRTTRASACTSGAITDDEWGAACTAGIICGSSAQPYPYGCSYNAGACGGLDSGLMSAAASGARALCASTDLDLSTPAVDPVYDLSGNLAEWTEDCRTVLADGTSRRAYTLRGGSYTHTAAALRCDFMSTVVAENFAFPDTGFRCCSSCRPGLADCPAGCVDLGSDAGNCGACGQTCAGGQTCSNGRCR
ncbi:MAG TPA: MopE-related protein [Polyangia bacterium]